MCMGAVKSLFISCLFNVYMVNDYIPYETSKQGLSGLNKW